MEAPVGLTLRREEVPALFELLDQLRTEVAPMRFHTVLVTREFNAAVAQVPRLGVFGWFRSYLLLGLPLMQSVDAEEFKAVLAHEFAHLSNRDGGSGSWVYRIRRSWEQMIGNVERNGGRGSFALRPFVSWFWPRFNAHAFVLSRLQEYRADETGGRFAGKETMGRALTRIALRGRWMQQDFWPPVMRRVNDRPEAPERIYQEIGDAAKVPLDPTKARRWLEEALRRPTDHSDTHPSLLDRLRALGIAPSGGAVPAEPPVPGRTAADVFLGDRLPGIVASLSGTWRQELSPAWAARHEEVRQIRAGLVPEEEVRTLDDAWKWAAAMIDLEDDEAAMPWIARVLAMDSRHVGARFVSGRHLLAQGDARGVGVIEEVMFEERSLAMPALGLLHDFHSAAGNIGMLEELTRRADALDDFFQLVDQEREGVSKSDTLLPHSLPEDSLVELAGIFESEGDIARVQAVRKDVRHLPQTPMHVFSVTVKAPAFSLRSANADQELVARLIGRLPVEGTSFVFIHGKDMKWLGKRMSEIPDSLIYEKAKARPHAA